MYRIGMFSKLGKTTIKTLRHYDEIGLLRPAQIDGETGYRYYTTEQLFQLHRIMGLRQMGFSTREIADILDGRQVEEILRQRKIEIEKAVIQAADQLSRINYFIANRKEGISMGYQAVVKDIAECIVFSKRQRIPDYAALNQVMPAMGEAVATANPGLQCAEPEYCFNIYHDGEYRDKDIDVEVCQAVTSWGVDTDGIVFKTMPGVTAVTTMHRGPYSALGGAYAFLFQWIEDNGYKSVDNPRESYIDGIWNKESESEWLTEVQVPIEKA